MPLVYLYLQVRLRKTINTNTKIWQIWGYKISTENLNWVSTQSSPFYPLPTWSCFLFFATEFNLYSSYTRCLVPTTGVWFTYQKTHALKTWLLSLSNHQLSRSPQLGMWAGNPLPHSILEYLLVWSYAGLAQATMVSMISRVYQLCPVQKTLFCLSPPYRLVLTTFLTSFPNVS